MQQSWTDPRTGTAWTVTMTPFGASRTLHPGQPRSIAFHTPGSPPAWTRQRLSKALHDLSDQEFMDLLDRARLERGTLRLRPENPGPRAAAGQG